jgi:CRISPR-associated protein Cas1
MSDDRTIQQAALAPVTAEAAPFKPLEQGWDGQLRFDFGDGAALEPREDEPPIRVMALHALLYCERLFYLEEVEEIRVANANVYAGRRLHDEVVSEEDETPEQRSVEVASEQWGIQGKVDAVRKRDGEWIAYEHKKGRCRRGVDNQPEAWPSDRIQAIAYAVLLEEAFAEPVRQARIRYHADNVTAFITVDDTAREELRQAITRARELRRTTQRPPVTNNENLCARCSLNVVCLPEEERLAQAIPSEELLGEVARPRLFPSNRERQTLHVVSHKARVGRSSETLVITTEEETKKIPINEIDAVVIHGYGQVSTQALQLCAHRGVAVQWMTAGGRFIAGTTASPGRVQQRIRQYAALTQPNVRLELARRLVHAKVESQLRYLLRATRDDSESRQAVKFSLDRIRESLRCVANASSPESLRGLEGLAAKAYFAALPHCLIKGVAEELIPHGRSKHPPRDRFNCLLSFGYEMIYTVVHRSILAVGLEPAFGFFHQPRSAAPPLVLDLMELFRTSLWEIPLIGSINRNQWNIREDFEVAPNHVWLTESGRKKALQLFEERLLESHKHPYTGQSLAYSRMVELEVRLLEKEWSGCPNLFAKLRLR